MIFTFLKLIFSIILFSIPQNQYYIKLWGFAISSIQFFNLIVPFFYVNFISYLVYKHYYSANFTAFFG